MGHAAAGGRPRSGLPAAGLVKGSNPHAVIYSGGSRLCLSPHSRSPSSHVRGKRGLCVGMSKHAKATAVKLFNSIDRRRVRDTWFSTCTLPASESMSVKRFKATLERYFARVQRAWGDRLSWYWAMEPTAAGVFHLHAILVWVEEPPSLRRFRAWNDLAWSSSTRCTHPSHRRAACNVQQARHWGGVRSYLSGYLSPAKWACWTGGPTGRVHGVRNRHLLPISPDHLELTPSARAILQRAVAKLRARRCSGAWTICRDTGKRLQSWADKLPACSHAARELIKHLARVGHSSTSMKLTRRRARFWRNECGWIEERETRNGVEGPPRIMPEREDEFGRPLPTWARGPTELQLDHLQGVRLVEWAVREDIRRRAEQRRFDELGVPF